MPILIPPYCTSNTPFGERRVFSLFHESDRLDDCIVFHSLHILNHQFKREGEADYVILSPEGLLVVEIKGCSVLKREEGKWIYRTNEKAYTSTESPFEQAKTNRDSIVKDINNSIGIDLKNYSGYGVIFPNIIFNEISPEWNKNLYLDENNLSGLANYIKELFRYWKEKNHNHNNILLSEESVDKIKNYIRGNFEVIQSFLSASEHTIKLINSLTEDQYKVLDALQENPRLMVKGYAGSGKTILAIERAKRLAYDKKKVLLLCYNKLLSLTIKEQLKDYKEYISVQTYDSLVYELLLQGNISPISLDINERRKYLLSTVSSIFFSDKYDDIIVDEGQDIVGDLFIAIINTVLKSGLTEGNWCLFYDDEIQCNLFSIPEFKGVLNMISKFAVKVNLLFNCRNPRQIGEEIQRVTSLPISEKYLVDTVTNHFELDYYSGDEDKTNILTSVILNYLKEGVEPNQITILFANTDYSILKSVYHNLNGKVKTFVNLHDYFNVDKDNVRYKIDNKCISYSTIQSYKGLENNYIVLCNIDTISTEFERAILYVGMTRAKVKLNIIANKNLELSLTRKV